MTRQETPVPLDWIELCGGCYMMGSDGGSGSSQPAHAVTVPAFEMLRSEVTVAAYRACVAAGACDAPAPEEIGECNWVHAARDDHPVDCVQRDDAERFAEWVGGGARLCSEAEWEYAARSGGRDQAYPWGQEPPDCSRSVFWWLSEEHAGTGCDEGHTGPVCSKPAGDSAQGICDLVGNCSEWVADAYHTSYHGAPVDGSPWTSPPSDRGVLRGGSYLTETNSCEATKRHIERPEDGWCGDGIRLCRDQTPDAASP